uniref:nuclear protein MDM1-like isoform X2 n=1 Tax=Podarcis muralis TaxID=64176 RepID=UPI0010A07BB9|nr:nuclear protein MDM1-like isoform X2 [Podarcis muralis]
MTLQHPAAGGAVLVSPPKVKSSPSLHVRQGSSEKHALASQISREDLKRTSNRVDDKDTPLSPSPAAGLKTVDPLPLRKDQWCSRESSGGVASPKRSWMQLPLQERNYNDEDDDDRLSQLSARSAASSSLASQVLERAQRRKENFWGKM